MVSAHAATDAPDLSSWLPLLPLLLTAAAYATGVIGLHQRGDHWPAARTAAYAAGLACLAAATLPPVATHDEQFTVHVAQHLLLASAAPLLLALSAPLTLALRTLPLRPRRTLLAVVHSRAAALLHPVVVLVLDIGALYAFYLTPMFAAAEQHPLLHAAVHLHMLAAGCLLSWYLVGTDPMLRRASMAARVLVLVTAAGAHDVLVKLMYVHRLPMAGGTPGQIQAGAQLMFYGGDAIEILLAIALLTAWYTRTGRELARQARRANTLAPGPDQPRAVATGRRSTRAQPRAHQPAVDVSVSSR